MIGRLWSRGASLSRARPVAGHPPRPLFARAVTWSHPPCVLRCPVAPC